jgi:predicted heme/steroid binding protein
MKEFDLESLKEFNGKEGKAVYIAHQGKVFDVTNSKFWKTGVHMKRHPSGTDLTADIEAAPHGPEVLDRYPQVGILKTKEEPARPMPKWLGELLDRFPVLRRHPHPMVVHFPIVFSIAPTLFILLFLVTKYSHGTPLSRRGDPFHARGHIDRILYLVAELPGQTHETRHHQDPLLHPPLGFLDSGFPLPGFEP